MDVIKRLREITDGLIKRIDDYENGEVSLSDTLYYMLDDQRCIKHLAEENQDVDKAIKFHIDLAYYTTGKVMSMLIENDCEELDEKEHGKLSRQYAKMYFKMIK